MGAFGHAGRDPILNTYIFISPHLDDIALSCGGYAGRLAGQGCDVIWAALCTADAPAGQPLSPAARHEHWQWQLGPRPYEHRRLEDAAASARLGGRSVHLGLLDAVYRHDDVGAPLYEGKQFMSGQVHPHDWTHLYPRVAEALGGLLRPLSRARIFCPLTLGGHVDHVIARRAVEQLCAPGQIAYYEDYPYADKDRQALAPYLSQAGEGGAWRPAVVELTPQEIEARVEAIACYRSQLFALFGEAETMPQRVREYVARVGGERYWERTEQP